jgi:hypothetical protein
MVAATPETAHAMKATATPRRRTFADLFIDSYPLVSMQARLVKVFHVGAGHVPADSQFFHSSRIPKGGQFESDAKGIFI